MFAICFTIFNHSFWGIDCRVDHFEPWQYHTILASKAGMYPDAVLVPPNLNNGMPTQAPELKWVCLKMLGIPTIIAI